MGPWLVRSQYVLGPTNGRAQPRSRAPGVWAYAWRQATTGIFSTTDNNKPGARFCKNQQDTRQLSRPAFTPEFLKNKAPEKQGPGKAGCPPHPRSACNKNARGGADHPAFPAQWFYGLYVISLVTGLFC